MAREIKSCDLSLRRAGAEYPHSFRHRHYQKTRLRQQYLRFRNRLYLAVQSLSCYSKLYKFIHELKLSKELLSRMGTPYTYLIYEPSADVVRARTRVWAIIVDTNMEAPAGPAANFEISAYDH